MGNQKTETWITNEMKTKNCQNYQNCFNKLLTTPISKPWLAAPKVRLPCRVCALLICNNSTSWQFVTPFQFDAIKIGVEHLPVDHVEKMMQNFIGSNIWKFALWQHLGRVQKLFHVVVGHTLICLWISCKKYLTGTQYSSNWLWEIKNILLI